MLVRYLDNALLDNEDYTSFYEDEDKSDQQSNEQKYFRLHYHNMKTTILIRESLILAKSIWVENTDTNS